jgi:hypothetical protein
VWPEQPPDKVFGSPLKLLHQMMTKPTESRHESACTMADKGTDRLLNRCQAAH